MIDLCSVNLNDTNKRIYLNLFLKFFSKRSLALRIVLFFLNELIFLFFYNLKYF
jgi:hypothetical protein